MNVQGYSNVEVDLRGQDNESQVFAEGTTSEGDRYEFYTSHLFTCTADYKSIAVLVATSVMNNWSQYDSKHGFGGDINTELARAGFVGNGFWVPEEEDLE